ncbi:MULTISPECIES: hypothetical protein [Bradyrhizobium]|uniref:Proteophosphoglycan ppg4 n=1 Tax=Bradyrhizobium brasilense TaxID=1419277 RepID=A0ABY8JEF9_9BRAD|nr:MULTISPECIES: hypothetical protein [Bradyrhizobium]MCP1910086.1 hypothetical protein [Bradyrhizobium elkanii]KRQ09256.1 hypothetical protein AOQ73_11170 [Bradyrhizobium pachyrhizi]MCC8946359.1 hypothetical protein [Bradyrhizobium brasilense]MCP1836040.1 hypothetical protein [Bradyrhizobium sp. USDA 4545]MCP1839261.1 hypothetical protein [Bradyrhizobium sp. USDA 4538]
MTFAKTSVLALAISAAMAGPVLAQGTTAPDTRGGAQGRGTMQQGGGMSGSGDEEMTAQPGATTQKSGAAAKSGSKGTVGSGRTAPKSGGSEMAPATKKY